MKKSSLFISLLTRIFSSKLIFFTYLLTRFFIPIFSQEFFHRNPFFRIQILHTHFPTRLFISKPIFSSSMSQLRIFHPHFPARIFLRQGVVFFSSTFRPRILRPYFPTKIFSPLPLFFCIDFCETFIDIGPQHKGEPDCFQKKIALTETQIWAKQYLKTSFFHYFQNITYSEYRHLEETR